MDGIFAGNSPQKQRNVFLENYLQICLMLAKTDDINFFATDIHDHTLITTSNKNDMLFLGQSLSAEIPGRKSS